MRILRPQSHGHGRLYPTHLPRRRYLRTWIRRSYPDYASEQSSAGAVSEVDKLFAKFVLTGPPPTAPTSTMTFPTSTSSMTLESLFAALSGPEIVGPAPPHTSLAPSASTPATGINLLDRIFASAANVSALSHQPQQQGAPRKISSPTPTSTSTQAQVLNQDVISTLLGLPPSRTPSAASSSHPSSRESDNEDENEDDEAGSPVSGRGNGLLSVLGHGGARNGNGKGGQQAHKHQEEEDSGEEEEDIVELDFEETSVLSDLDAFRRAVSEQKRGLGSQKDGQSLHTHRGVVVAASRRLRRVGMFLGFQDRQQQQQVKTTTTTTRYLTQAVTSPPASPSPPLSPSLEDNTPQMPVYTPQTSAHTPPPPRSVHTPQMRVHMPPRPVHTPSGPAHTPSPRRIPSLSDMMTPTMSGKTNGAGTGTGKGRKVAPSLNGSGSVGKGTVNGHGHVEKNGEENGNGHEHALVRGSIVAALNAHAQPRLGGATGMGMERNEFVREVLTLIHIDKAFVDTLWQEYLARLQ
ncbi:uncharacterized protein LACBIDRAFT_332672 [Laccaria bicolor S238N-H82]|uniref:Predicted protein n=1 Tax=Laccaria bicolor (strain S238N-H82 / ATCC MYA-4686) TaxID=486041 RepID=B0DTH9_LACBS|nr:uncharacterized protein LACBIDRAFT_332672 [Laccaria bicolor S238N-H82]EDR02115.1 predicted protein [Laccaria bicolor S238N-H82]|eukprot:XP_001887272.1 predicted protein [Laccaria bicolor S238N-H82]